MKDKELKFGTHKAGKFLFSVNKVTLDNSPAHE